MLGVKPPSKPVHWTHTAACISFTRDVRVRSLGCLPIVAYCGVSMLHWKEVFLQKCILGVDLVCFRSRHELRGIFA